MFGGLGNIPAMLKAFQQIQEQTKDMQSRLAQVRVQGRAGGEMVVVEASGQQQILGVRIERSLLESGDAEMLEDLLISATNQALDKAREAAAQEMSKMTSSITGIPGVSEMMSKFGLGGADGNGPGGGLGR